MQSYLLLLEIETLNMIVPGKICTIVPDQSLGPSRTRFYGTFEWFGMPREQRKKQFNRASIRMKRYARQNTIRHLYLKRFGLSLRRFNSECLEDVGYSQKERRLREESPRTYPETKPLA